jgi:hypothetical protein
MRPSCIISERNYQLSFLNGHPFAVNQQADQNLYVYNFGMAC